MRIMALPSIIADFQVLPVAIPPLPSFPKQVLHPLYVRRDAPQVPTPKSSRQLFLVNVPVDSTEAHFRALFATLLGAGRFESIVFEEDNQTQDQANSALPTKAVRLQALAKKRKRDADEEDSVAAELQTSNVWPRRLHRSGSIAVVLLVDEKSVELSLRAVAKLHKTKKFPVWGEGVETRSVAVSDGGGGTADRPHALGVPFFQAHNELSYPSKSATQERVDAFFVDFNRREKEAAELAKRLRSEPDDDGFVTVTRGGGRAAAASRDEAEEARRRMVEKQEKKKRELSDFYRFQLRERKKAEHAELREKFQLDRRRAREHREGKRRGGGGSRPDK